MTYIPSLLFLTFLTDVDTHLDEGFRMGWWALILPVILISSGVLMWYAKQLEPYEPETPTKGILSRVTWINVLTLSAAFFLVGLFSNHNDVFHYRASAERALVDSSYTKALEIGKEAHVTDSSLTMIRIYALAMKGELGDHLFVVVEVLAECLRIFVNQFDGYSLDVGGSYSSHIVHRVICVCDIHSLFKG